ncbi:MAG: lysine--tRNA ligase [Patescibacteria group bacterium]|nr:lysine--tRNA ligase [Patescibacteria group bacterium]
MSRLEDTIEAKLEKRDNLEAMGVKPHPYSFDKKQNISQVIDTDEGVVVKTAGRIMAMRAHGKVIFLDLKDSTAKVQVMMRQGEVEEKQFEMMSYVDTGDFLGVEGQVATTRTGELTILAQEAVFLGKALRPIPTKWNTAEDKDVRFRQRYIDMLINDDVKKVLDTRWMVEKMIRRYLQDEHDFVEVETPVLQSLYGGTNASPFTTHMNALDTDFYLRIAPELYLKRLIVGGYEKVFEIARNFRNEGIDQTHQPEFTMIEWYQAYADYNLMMDVAEGLIKKLVATVALEGKLMVGKTEIDVTGDWPRIKMIDVLKERADIDIDELSDQQLKDLLTKHELKTKGGFTRGKAMFVLFDNLVAPQLIQPIWIIDYPRDVSPLSKAHRLDSKYCERYEAYVGGKELADGWSEIVDPLDQRQIFENEQKNMRAGDEEAHPLDEDFLRAMEYGMPPLGGIGIGIDRLVMFLTNTWSIREVIAFPTLKRKGQTVKVGAKKIKVQSKESKVAAETEIKKEVNNNQLPDRKKSEALLEKYIENENLRNHCRMVAEAVAAYARKLGEDEELWYQAGLLHDLDWEKYPDEHPMRAINELLVEYPIKLIEAVKAHAPHITGKQPETKLEKYLFACDELSGFMNAYALMRPTNFKGMKASKVKKKLKDVSFAANVNRDDIKMGFDMIEQKPSEHIQFLIEVFDKLDFIFK